MEPQHGPTFDQFLNEELFGEFGSWSLSSNEMVGILPSGSPNSGVPPSGFVQSLTVAPWDLTIGGEEAQPWPESEQQSVVTTAQPISNAYATDHSQDSLSLGQSTQTEGTVSRKRNSPQKWEEYKGIIKSWYIDKGHTLENTMKMMRVEHQFVASDKAYKLRLKAWKFEKNSKKKGRSELGTTSRGGRQAGRETANTVSGIYMDVNCRPSSGTCSNSSTVACFNPQSHKRKQRSSNIGLVEMAGGFERRDTDMLLSSLSLFTTDSAPTESIKLLAHNPLFRTTLEPLKDSLTRNLALVPSHDLIAPNPYNDELSSELVGALDAFMRKCSEHNEPSFAMECFDKGALALLMSGQFADGMYEDKPSVALAIQYCHAKCLLACERYSETEKVLDRLLLSFQRIHDEDEKVTIRRSLPAILLLAKTYLAQGNLYHLENLLFAQINAIGGLGCYDEMREEIVVLQKMLLVFGVAYYATQDAPAPGIRMNAGVEEHLGALIERIQEDPDERMFTLGIMTYLRSRYDKLWDEVRLIPVLQKIESILLQVIDPESDEPAPPLVLYAVGGLIRSYYPLRRYDDIKKWRREQVRQISMLEMVGPSACNTAHAGMDGMDAVRYNPRNQLYPLYVVCRDFVWRDWPYVSLPWDTIDGVLLEI